MTSRAFQVASRQLLRQGWECLAAGGVRHASEKDWGAAAQMVKSIAERRAWQHRNHAALFAAVSLLVNEAGDEDIPLLFAVANSRTSISTRIGKRPTTWAATWLPWSDSWTSWSCFCGMSSSPELQLPDADQIWPVAWCC